MHIHSVDLLYTLSQHLTILTISLSRTHLFSYFVFFLSVRSWLVFWGYIVENFFLSHGKFYILLLSRDPCYYLTLFLGQLDDFQNS